MFSIKPQSNRMRSAEGVAAAWSFILFFCLLCSYYIVRPVRDEMAVQSGVQNLQWLFTATFGVMLVAIPVFGFISGRWPRSRVVPLIYVFFGLTLAIFFLLFASKISSPILAAALFVWISVYNFFVVSVFWSLMADIFSNQQAKRLFGRIAAGGSLGAVMGPLITVFLVRKVGLSSLLFLSSCLLLTAAFCAFQLNRKVAKFSGDTPRSADIPLGGEMWAGIKLTFSSKYLVGISGFVLLLSLLATVLYFEQVQIVGEFLPGSDDRTRLFAQIDFAVNSLTLFTQLALTQWIISRLGVAGTLLIVTILGAAGFALLALSPALLVVVGLQIMRRVSEFAVVRPVREILFTKVRREEKYKAKNFIDTVVYRGGDAGSGWLIGALHALGASSSMLAAFAVPFAAITAILGWRLGVMQESARDNNILRVPKTIEESEIVRFP
jgi:ATP:ADP antiporter, AAA family